MRLNALLLAIIAAVVSVSCGFSGVEISVTHSHSLTPQKGYVLMSANEGPPLAFAADLNGHIPWKYKFDTHSGTYQPQPIQPFPNGHLIVLAAHESGIAPCSDCGEFNAVQEIDPAGNLIWQLTNQQLQDELTAAGYSITLGQLSHDVILLPNSHVILLASNIKTVAGQNGQIEGAVLIDLGQDHHPVWVWDAFDHLDVNRHPYFKLPDWIHGNAVTYSPDDGNLLFSSRAQSWIIKINYRNGSGTGDVIWRLGYQGDFTLLNGAPSDWFYGQHAPIFLSSNSTGIFQLGLFDNGNARVMNADGAHCGDSGQPACYSTVPIFQVDEVNRTAKVMWRDTLPFFSSAVGNMQVLDNGHVWFNAGNIGGKTVIREVTVEASPQTVLEMRVNTIVYRAIHVQGSTIGLP